MNGDTLIYNVPSGMYHSFQANGAQVAYFYSGGLAMNSNTIGFSNTHAGLSWGSNYSRIYDDSNLNITTDDAMYISAPTQLNITSPSSYFSGNVYTNNNVLASQSWVQGQTISQHHHLH